MSPSDEPKKKVVSFDAALGIISENGAGQKIFLPTLCLPIFKFIEPKLDATVNAILKFTALYNLLYSTCSFISSANMVTKNMLAAQTFPDVS